MKTNIILSGVGGQGILTIAAVLDTAALHQNLYVKQSEVHGMSQRGGDVQSHLRISDKEIFSDLIPQGGADLIISVEPMEALRYMPYLSQNGWFITNTTPFVNIPNYPDTEKIMNEVNAIPNHVAINADQIAKGMGANRSMNMVMLGAASLFLDIPYEKLEEGIKFVFGRKGEEIVEANLKAMKAGKDFTEENK